MLETFSLTITCYIRFFHWHLPIPRFKIYGTEVGSVPEFIQHLVKGWQWIGVGGAARVKFAEIYHFTLFALKQLTAEGASICDETR